ncbi:MAG TPA: sugar phosphate nucleotidyltransferase [Fimbriimonadaceae bacterium]|nr:sugar phosphate nucleotidyltransferase [Fimbriimonadaceae bacterium]
MKAVVLAAGKGSRLYPVTHAVAKPLLPLANRMTMEYAFDQFRWCGIDEVCIVVGENEKEVRAALGDGALFGMRLHYSVQDEPLGLAHAVRSAKEFVDGDDFVLYLGDEVYGESLAPFVKQFVESGAANLNLVKAVEDPRRFGVANVLDGRIVKLVEKPAVPESNLAMAGMYVFGPQLWGVLPELKPSARGEYEITDAIQLMIDRGEHVIAGVYEGEWFDTGTLSSFLTTSRFLVNGGQLIDSTARVVGDVKEHVVVGAGAVVECSSITDTVVLPGATVRAKRIDGCLLGGEVTRDDIVGEILYGDLK